MNAIRTELRTLAGAVLFFTRLPLPARLGVEAADLRRAITYFPLCGALVGGFAALGTTMLGWRARLRSSSVCRRNMATSASRWRRWRPSEAARSR